MFAAFKNLIDEIIPHEGARAPALPLRLAAAVLLMEVMRASDGISAEEKAAASRALSEQFAADDADMLLLLKHAEQESQAAYDYFRFTNPLDEQLPHERKVALVEAMWKVAYADGHVDEHENAVISKVADLLHVSHGEYIAAKMRAGPRPRGALP
jgi:uncharacterized tellurite resistance protein B-like protein